jgi:hypothetical protein
MASIGEGEPRADFNAQGASSASRGWALGGWRRPRWPLVDRGSERAVIDDLLERVRQGLSRVLVLRGGDGVGKTRLVDYAVEAASGFRISAVAGVESEINLPHGAVHQLLIATRTWQPAWRQPRRGLGTATLHRPQPCCCETRSL